LLKLRATRPLGFGQSLGQGTTAVPTNASTPRPRRLSLFGLAASVVPWMVRQALANAQLPERKRTKRERAGVAPLIPYPTVGY